MVVIGPAGTAGSSALIGLEVGVGVFTAVVLGTDGVASVDSVVAPSFLQATISSKLKANKIPKFFIFDNFFINLI
jgi:hypothetical protein